MKKILLFLISFLFCVSLTAQVNWIETKVKGEGASAIGIRTISGNEASFASGYKSQALGKFSSAFGEQSIANDWASFASGYKCEANGRFSHAFGLFAKSESMAGIAIGKYIKTTGPNAVAIGVGYGDSELINNLGNSLMVGFHSTVPTFFVGQNEWNEPDGLGKVGIGTTEPGSLLQVNGNVAIGYENNTSAPGNGLLVHGNLGINTTNPTEKLQVNGTGYLTDNLYIGGKSPDFINLDGNDLYINGQLEQNGGGGASFHHIAIGDISPNSFSQGTLMVEDKAGIGTTNPGGLLGLKNDQTYIDVNDNGDLIFKDANNAETKLADVVANPYPDIYNTNDGNVGINNNNPQANFQVNNSYNSISFGNARTEDLEWSFGYIGFNAARDNNGVWHNKGATHANGAIVMYTTNTGDYRIASLESDGSGNDRTFSDSQIKEKVLFRLQNNGKIMVKEVEVI